MKKFRVVLSAVMVLILLVVPIPVMAAETTTAGVYNIQSLAMEAQLIPQNADNTNISVQSGVVIAGQEYDYYPDTVRFEMSFTGVPNQMYVVTVKKDGVQTPSTTADILYMNQYTADQTGKVSCKGKEAPYPRELKEGTYSVFCNSTKIATFQYREYDTNAVQAVVDLIDKIDNPVTLDSKGAIDAARNAYMSLSEEQQKRVENYATLTAAEAKLAELEQFEHDRTAAAAVDKQIKEIGTVTLESENAIVSARKAYDALNPAAQNMVINLGDLEKDEIKFAELKQAEQVKANNVDAQIAAIGNVTLKSDKAIAEARSAYDSLSNTAKRMVKNLTLLQNAEAKLTELRKQAHDANTAPDNRTAFVKIEIVKNDNVKISSDELNKIGNTLDESVLNSLIDQAARSHKDSVVTKEMEETVKINLGLDSMRDTDKISNIHFVNQVQIEKNVQQYGENGMTISLTANIRTLLTYAEDEQLFVLNENGNNTTANAVVYQDWNKMVITVPLTMRMPLPEAFVKANSDKELYVRHVKDNGKEYTYEGQWIDLNNDGIKEAVQFENPNGFSTFTVGAVKKDAEDLPVENVPAFDWTSIYNAIVNGGKTVEINVGNESEIPNQIWQAFYGQDKNVIMIRGFEKFRFNGLELQNSGFDPDHSHSLTDLAAYSMDEATNNAPQTGNKTNLMVWIALIALCSAGAFIISKKLKN